MNKSDYMETGSVPRLLLQFSLPAVVGLLVNALYNIIDSIFVGRGVGELGLAGVTVSFPIITGFIAVTMLIGMGATALISLRLGQKRGEDAERIIGNAFVLLVVLGVSLTVFGLIFLNPILSFFGASREVLPYSIDYMRIILLGTVFMAIGGGMNNFIRAEGNPKIAMNTMIIGTVTNIILDYVFIFIFHWGISGAAFATVLSYCVTSTCVLYYFLRGSGTLKIRRKNLKLKSTLVKGIVVIGFPTFVLQVTGSIQQLILNRSLAYYGGDMALAVIGIIMSVVMFLVMPAMGISQGAQPIIGYNYGANKIRRVRHTLLLSIFSATGLVAIGFIVSKIWPRWIIGLFTKNFELIEMGCYAMDIFFKFLPLVAMQMISSSYFQAVGKPTQATLLGLSRQVFIFIPLLFILPYFKGLDGVWLSGPFSDLGAFIFTGIWLLIEIRHLKKRMA